MLSFLPAPLLGALSLMLFVVNLVFWMIPFLVVTAMKILVPLARWRELCGRWLIGLAELWIEGNNLIVQLHDIELEVHGAEGLRRDEWYVISSNHQSWVDIFVLQWVFNRRIPFLKFFIKKQLIWVPLLGVAWWALDMPFMQRHSRELLERRPELRGQDLEATRRACERFQHTPTSIISFIEGTRYTPAKHEQQNSPFRHLLKPKTGGMAFVMSTMGGMLHSMLDVTIAYPRRGMTFWDLLSGRIDRIVVHVDQQPIPQEFTQGDYLNDAQFREHFRAWINASWQRKDQLLDELLADTADSR